MDNLKVMYGWQQVPCDACGRESDSTDIVLTNTRSTTLKDFIIELCPVCRDELVRKLTVLKLEGK